jgi:hypothetical protein
VTYSLPSTVRVIKWRRLGWVRYMGEQENAFNVLAGKPRGELHMTEGGEGKQCV